MNASQGTRKSRKDSIGEIQRMTGHVPSKAYNHLANIENQKKIIEVAAEAKEKGLSYGELVAQKYLSENRMT